MEAVRLCRGKSYQPSLLFSVLKKELGKRLGRALICSDSKIVIHWSTRGSEQLQPYILNRVETIRANVDVLDELHYVKTKFNLADLCTKYRRVVDFEQPTVFSNNRLLTHQDMSPTSTWFRGMPWYSDLAKTIEKRIISPALEIFEKNIVLSPEEQAIYTSTHKNKTSQLSKTVNFLLDDFNMTEAKTDKNTTDALVTDQEEDIAMITVE